MKNAEFKGMWEKMQEKDYFANHPHYSDHFGSSPSKDELALDRKMLSLDFTQNEITMPIPYSDALERSVKRTESVWLYEMFALPKAGVALDVGCGFGRSVKWMAQHYSRVIGTDISENVISKARANCAALQNVEFFTNDSNSIAADIEPASIDVAYIFTVFQHIPREFSVDILSSVGKVLRGNGKVVFNLLSNINEDLNSGIEGTEWAIGYSEEQAAKLVEQSGLHLDKIVSWSRPETEVRWLWVCARAD
ncbi:MAG: class I SAM-dependent methyltransferase [Pseudohongiellaceae bacterium]